MARETYQQSNKQGEIRAPVSRARDYPGSDQGEEWSHQSRERDGWVTKDEKDTGRREKGIEMEVKRARGGRRGKSEDENKGKGEEKGLG